MNRKTFLDPTSLKWSYTPASSKIDLSVEYLAAHYQFSPAETKHRAFAAGFFAFHYIRATLEKDPSLKRDSLCFLRRLLASLGVEKTFVENLNRHNQQSYADFEGKVIKPISLELGDSFCPSVQWMMRFGFHFAIGLSILVTATEQKLYKERTDSLKSLERWIPSLVSLAFRAEVSEAIAVSLARCDYLFKHSKTKSTTRKCRNIITLIANQLLVTGTAAEVLN